MAGCCDPNYSPKATLPNVGDRVIGVLGLKGTREEVPQLGVSDRGQLKLELMSRFRERNYLSGGAEAEYEAAFLHKYLRLISK